MRFVWKLYAVSAWPCNLGPKAKFRVHKAPFYRSKSLMEGNYPYVYFTCPAEAFFGDPNRHLRLTPPYFPSVATLLLLPGVCYYGLIFDLLPSMCVCAPLHSRPGSCAGHSPAASFKSSIEFPDDTLQFIKSHPLMDTAVPSLGDEPWFTKTRVR